MNWTDRREMMRRILQGSRCVFPASVHDGISARAADELGFEMMMMAGSIASFTVLAAPDLCVLTLSEFADQAYRINRAGRLPLLVDADHGYGNALNVRRTVEELETAGVSALTIEDTLLPVAFGSPSTPSLISIEEGVGKMRAALAGRQDPGLVIASRSSAADIAGLPEAIKRFQAYEAAGVDALFLAGIKSRAQVDAIAEAVSLPLILGDVSADIREPGYLSARGIKVCLQGHNPFWTGVNATYEALKALREGTKPEDMKGVAPADLRRRLVREDNYKSWQQEFLL